MPIQKIFYCFHPDFIQDDNEPKGYKVLCTGKWVVEWDRLSRRKEKYHNNVIITHYKKPFTTKPEAENFYNVLMKRYNRQETRFYNK